jgi:hypothetical protein
MSVTIFSFSVLMRGSFALKCSDLIPEVRRHASSVLLPHDQRSSKRLEALVAEKALEAEKNRGGER